MQPKEIGKYYWHKLTYPAKPKVVFEPAHTQEIDEPFRSGTGYAIRVPFTRTALVVGKWGQSLGESEALTVAIGGRYLPEDQLDWDVVRFGLEVES